MIEIIYEKQNEDIKSPNQATEADSGFDMFSPEHHVLTPSERRTINLGIKFHIKSNLFGENQTGLGIEMQIRPTLSP